MSSILDLGEMDKIVNQAKSDIQCILDKNGLIFDVSVILKAGQVIPQILIIPNPKVQASI